MDVLTKAKLKLAKMLDIKFESVDTDRQPLHFDGELAQGKDVFIMDENGNMEPAPEGTYNLDDGRVVQVEDGRVVSIDDPESGSPADTDMEAENIDEAETIPETGEVEPSDFNDLVEIVNDLVAEVKEMESDIDDLQGELAAVTEDYKKTTTELARVKEEFARATRPKGKPAESKEPEKPKSTGSFKATGIERVDKAIGIMKNQ